MRNLVLVDFKLDDDWSFSRILNTQGRWDVKSCVTNTSFYHTRLGTIVRYLLYFLFPLRYVLSAQFYGVVLGWQQFYALNYAFWLRLLRIRSSVRIVVMTFIYIKRRRGFLGVFITSTSAIALPAGMSQRLFVIPGPKLPCTAVCSICPMDWCSLYLWG